MPAIAFSNNDVALVAWTFDRHLDGCLGFAVYRIDADGKSTPLPALAKFAGQPKDPNRTTEQAPVQKFWWKDLYAQRGGTYSYRIVPIGGTPGQTLAPLAGIAPLVSNAVTLTEKRPPFEAYFNRGIVATQALSHALNDKPSVPALKPHIEDPNDPIRKNLEGQLFEGVTSLLDRADASKGTINAALYELNDPKGLEVRLQAADHGDPKSRNVILGNEPVAKTATSPASDDADADNRAALKHAGVTVIDRVLRKGDIPHNKFMVLTDNGAPSAVLSGSTNWTSTGLCTQTNNALVIESADVAKRYIAYWDALKADVAAAHGDQKKLQSATLRSWNHDNNDNAIRSPINLGNGVTIEPLFSPNTRKTLARPPKEKPNDMQRLFDLVGGAKQAVLFLAFDPGNNSILDAAGAALAANPDLFVRGALTSTQRASNFAEALHRGDENQHGDGTGMHVAVIGEPGKPRKKGATGKNKTEKLQPDYRSVPAGEVTVDDKFGDWEAEMYKYGFAIIHNKIVVIDPFSDNCVVITGSHNLGYRASHNNDENMLVIRRHRGLAEAYACHVLDLYDHYAWRFLLKQHPDIFGRPLEPDDKWQERYILGPGVKSPELRFWLAAATGGNTAPVPRASGSTTSAPATGSKSAPKASGATAAGTGGASAGRKSTKPAKRKAKAAAAEKARSGTRKKTTRKKAPAKKPAARKSKGAALKRKTR